MKHSFCEDWEFTRHWTEAFGKGLPVPKQQAVRLPHTCREVPLHYASPADYEMVCGYRKRFRVPPVQAAPRLFLRFDGAAHQAVVRVNGRVAGQHRGGYTGFAVEITDLVDREGENLLTVQLALLSLIYLEVRQMQFSQKVIAIGRVFLNLGSRQDNISVNLMNHTSSLDHNFIQVQCSINRSNLFFYIYCIISLRIHIY